MNRAIKTPRWPIGTTFTPRGGKTLREYTVTDVWTTTNAKGEVVRLRYVATHKFLGQTVEDCDVCDTTIARGNPRVPETP